MKGLSGVNIISLIAILAKWNFRNPMLAEGFLASNMYRLPTTTVVPLAKVDVIHAILREHAKVVVTVAVSKRSETVVDMEKPLEQKANNGGGHRTSISELLSWYPPVAAGRWIAQRVSPSPVAGPLPWAIQAATVAAAMLVASTTEEDIMSAIRGLDGSLSASSGSSQGQPAIVVGVPSNSDGGGQESSSKAGAPKCDVRLGNGGEGEFQGGGALELRGDTDLIKSLVGGPQQAGPLTHGF